MEHIAIDLGSRESQVCIRQETGKLVAERKVRTRDLGRVLGRRPAARVVVETSSEAFAVADVARQQGHEVRVVPATLVRSLGVGARGLKTDERDARALSDASCRLNETLPSVHVPSVESRERKALCTARQTLVGARTGLINAVRSYGRTRVVQIRSGASHTFADRARKALVEQAEGIPECIERLLVMIERLDEQIALADQEVRRVAMGDETCRRLMTMPGIGPVTALRLVSALDECERFERSAQVASYVGLTPGENSSGLRTQRTGITKAGAAHVRWTLVQAAWSMWRCRRGDPIVRWATEIEKRRGRAIAVVALARKMVTVLYAMWRDGTDYDPSRAAASIPSEEAVVR